ncbi:MAG: glutamate synthase large subunit [Methylophilaceae bacterium]
MNTTNPNHLQDAALTQSKPVKQGLYNPRNEHDACGVGFVAHIKGKKTHAIVQQGLELLTNLTHRGATGYDPKLGDGAGLLMQIPDAFMREEAERLGIDLPTEGQYAIGNFYLPRDARSRKACEAIIDEVIAEENQTLLGWRNVPVDNSNIADAARDVEPTMRQVFVGSAAADQTIFERKCFVIRKRIEHAVTALKINDAAAFYVPSFSSRTIVYKGMLLANEVGVYYKDLLDERVISALALVHQRFSTNTFPSWDLAHPFRMIAHNGEINTVQGNVNWMKARRATMESANLGEDLDKIWPLIADGQSDSACFDNCLELLVAGGYSVPHAMMMLIPEAWSNNPLMDEDRRAFYEYHAAIMEPWDGPAAVAFTDGQMIGATLDRNGLRPARYLVTSDDVVMMASEMGVITFPQEKIVKKWRLEPGKMLIIDTVQGRIIDDAEAKSALAKAKPYRQWILDSRYHFSDFAKADGKLALNASLLDTQQAFGMTQEDVKFLLQPMVASGAEASGSMGNDAALPVLSNKAKPLYNYFKQLFAQVTNPPIDPIREALVMSLVTFIGPKPNLLGLEETNPPLRLEADQPVLSLEELAQLQNIDALTKGQYKSITLDLTYDVAAGEAGMKTALDILHDQAEKAVKDGFNVLILSDRAASATRIAIPALLACSATHEFLVKAGLRTSTGLVIDTGSAREVHHFALLAGYGAEAVCPWLTFETIKGMADDVETANSNFIKAIGKGLFKVMSKMGISTYQSYCGAQIFEAIGLNSQFVEEYFTGTVTQIEGIGLAEVSAETHRVHNDAFGTNPVLNNALDAGGDYAFRVRGEEHTWTPESVSKLQNATRTNKYDTYKEYAKLINDQTRRHMTLRGLFEIKLANKAIPLEQVESAKEIVKRFATGAMSLGSISTEAHATLAIAMNRIGGKSNTGEGGEDKKRFIPVAKDSSMAEVFGKEFIKADVALKAGDSMRSRIKQVASGRFGVTAEYLASADQIQIKMAQGAKPGEGGQLPGHKVSQYIARLRFSVPGVGLISPPPHHDIYSIEDLAQLIHDLKNANPKASISTKLVSETGVGTVAAGVAKAKSDHIVVAGHDGGTGASPLSSIKHAGTPWELGLAETQQTLVLNQLRGRVIVQADGQMKTGRDVVIGALLGADEFGFATAPLVVEGCIMMRKCHLNTCPVGVATQDPELRKKFTGQPEHVVNFFFFIAEEIRELMAEIGIAKFDDLIGRADLLDMKKGIEHWKINGLDFTKVFHLPEMSASVSRYNDDTQDHGLANALDNKLIELAKPAIEKGEKVKIDIGITNTNRTVGTMLSNQIAKRYGNDGLPHGTVHVNFSGTSGQSFAAFLAKGITFELSGEGNDYVGKGLCGGRVIIKPPTTFSGVAHENIIVGNTVMYGATTGESYFSGVAGERFCVRNSGATAVIEGVGNHGCEYMTGGTVVVLGATGENFAAGMSGGIAYVYDIDGMFAKRCNMSMVSLEKVLPAEADVGNTQHLGQADEALLKGIIENQANLTGSPRAKEILANWDKAREKFVKVFPNEYKRALTELAAATTKNAA